MKETGRSTVRGKYIAPGFIDAHVHIESSMVTPLEFAKQIVKKGTTSIIADPHEIVNVCGAAGLDYILDATEDIPVNAFVMIPSSVPATESDTNGAGNFWRRIWSLTGTTRECWGWAR